MATTYTVSLKKSTNFQTYSSKL